MLDTCLLAPPERPGMAQVRLRSLLSKVTQPKGANAAPPDDVVALTEVYAKSAGRQGVDRGNFAYLLALGIIGQHPVAISNNPLGPLRRSHDFTTSLLHMHLLISSTSPFHKPRAKATPCLSLDLF